MSEEVVEYLEDPDGLLYRPRVDYGFYGASPRRQYDSPLGEQWKLLGDRPVPATDPHSLGMFSGSWLLYLVPTRLVRGGDGRRWSLDLEGEREPYVGSMRFDLADNRIELSGDLYVDGETREKRRDNLPVDEGRSFRHQSQVIYRDFWECVNRLKLESTSHEENWYPQFAKSCYRSYFHSRAVQLANRRLRVETTLVQWRRNDEERAPAAIDAEVSSGAFVKPRQLSLVLDLPDRWFRSPGRTNDLVLSGYAYTHRNGATNRTLQEGAKFDELEVWDLVALKTSSYMRGADLHISRMAGIEPLERVNFRERVVDLVSAFRTAGFDLNVRSDEEHWEHKETVSYADMQGFLSASRDRLFAGEGRFYPSRAPWVAQLFLLSRPDDHVGEHAERDDLEHRPILGYMFDRKGAFRQDRLGVAAQGGYREAAVVFAESLVSRPFGDQAIERRVFNRPLHHDSLVYLRTAVHEVGHMLGLGHEIGGYSLMAQSSTLVTEAAAKGIKFPANVRFQFRDFDRKRLTHIPDPLIAPGWVRAEGKEWSRLRRGVLPYEVNPIPAGRASRDDLQLVLRRLEFADPSVPDLPVAIASLSPRDSQEASRLIMSADFNLEDGALLVGAVQQTEDGKEWSGEYTVQQGYLECGGNLPSLSPEGASTVMLLWPNGALRQWIDTRREQHWFVARFQYRADGNRWVESNALSLYEGDEVSNVTDEQFRRLEESPAVCAAIETAEIDSAETASKLKAIVDDETPSVLRTIAAIVLINSLASQSAATTDIDRDEVLDSLMASIDPEDSLHMLHLAALARALVPGSSLYAPALEALWERGGKDWPAMREVFRTGQWTGGKQ